MRRENGAKENELQVLVHLRKPRLYRLVLLRIMQLTCSTDSVIQFLERLYPPLQVKLIVRGAEEREREGGRKGCKPRRGRRRTESKGVLSRNIRSGKVEEGYLFSAGDSSTERRDMPGNIAAANCKVSRVAKIFEQLIISTSGQLNKTNRRRATSPKKWLSPLRDNRIERRSIGIGEARSNPSAIVWSFRVQEYCEREGNKR